MDFRSAASYFLQGRFFSLPLSHLACSGAGMDNFNDGGGHILFNFFVNTIRVPQTQTAIEGRGRLKANVSDVCGWGYGCRSAFFRHLVAKVCHYD